MSSNGEPNPEIAREIAKKEFFRVLREASVKVKQLFSESKTIPYDTEGDNKVKLGKLKERAQVIANLPEQIKAIPGAEEFFKKEMTYIILDAQEAIEALKTDSWIMLGGLLIPRGLKGGEKFVDYLEANINHWSKELGE